jgi:bifunctional non-homologous end joining protein LigD
MCNSQKRTAPRDRNGNFKQGLWTCESVADRRAVRAEMAEIRALLRAARGRPSRGGAPLLAASEETAYFRIMWRASAGKRRPPGYIEPCIPTRVSKPPVGPEWVHEIKHDGYRLIARKRDDRVRLFTRRGYDWTQRYPRIASAVASLRTASAVVDGEAVFCDGTGVADFERLHSRAYDDQVFLYAFDLLELDGEDWRPRPLAERKAKLSKLIAKAPPGIRYGEHLEGDGATIFAHACKLGLEGIVSKHREHPYRSGRSKAWLKVKNPAAPGVLRFKNEEP